MVSGPNDVDPDAETQYGYSRYDDYEDYPYSPESAPTAIVTTRSDSSSVIAMAILAAAVMICAVIVVVVVMTKTPDTVTSTPAPTTIIRSTVTAAPEPSSPTPPPTRMPTAAPPTVQNTAVPAPAVPVFSSLQRLRNQATLDFRAGLNAGSLWVPQLSSKRPGTVDDGIVWDHDDIWVEHMRLRQQYGAILLWSADWNFGADDLWVTVATTGFPTADGARQWCLNHGRDTWHCFPAQLR